MEAVPFIVAFIIWVSYTTHIEVKKGR